MNVQVMEPKEPCLWRWCDSKLFNLDELSWLWGKIFRKLVTAQTSCKWNQMSSSDQHFLAIDINSGTLLWQVRRESKDGMIKNEFLRVFEWKTLFPNALENRVCLGNDNLSLVSFMTVFALYSIKRNFPSVFEMRWKDSVSSSWDIAL